jgi:hypothetical protein
MMHYNEELVSELNIHEMDMGEISRYHKEKDGSLKLKSHSSMFKINGQFIFNRRFNVPNEDKHTTRVCIGKKRKGMVFSCSFADFMSRTVRYCYEMKKNEIEVNKQYLAGNY